MKKRWLYLILLVTIIIISIGILVVESNVLNDYSILNAINSEENFNRIAYLTKDKYQNEYYKFTSSKTISDAVFKWLNLDIGDGQHYLMKLSPTGQVVLLDHINPDHGKIAKIVFDQAGNYYLHLIKRDDFEKYLLSERILKYDSDGNYLETVYEYVYPAGSREVSYIYGLQSDGNIYFYHISDGAIIRYIYDTQLYADMSYEGSTDSQIVDVVGVKNKNSYFYTQDSNLYGFIENMETGAVELNKLFDFWLRNEVITGIGMDLENQLIVSTIKLDKNETATYRYNPNNLTLTKVDLTSRETSRLINGDQYNLTLISRLFFKRISIWIVLILLIVLILYTRRFIRVYVLQQRRVLVMKLLSAFIPIIIIAMTFYVNYTYNNTYDVVKEELKNGKFMDFNKIIEAKLQEIDQANNEAYYLGNRLTDLKLGQITQEEFDEIAQLTRIEDMIILETDKGGDRSRTVDMSGIYRVIDIVKDRHVYKLVDNEGAMIFNPRFNRGDYESVFRKAALGDDVNKSSAGYLFSMQPIYNAKGQIVGVFQVGMNYEGYIRLTDRNLLFDNLKMLVLMTLGMILVLGLLIFKIVLPIGILTKDVSNVNEDNLDITVDIRSGDEVETLADAFKDMTTNLKEIIQNTIRLKDAYYRFVPEEFFKVMDKNDVTDVELGDHAKLDMCIMNSSISNYYEVSTSLSQTDSFNYINEYLGVVAPIIRNEIGIIDRYLDRGLIGIFSTDGLNAVDSAIKAAKELNEREHLNSRFSFNFGIHRGDMLLGIIGEEERVQTIILSDNVTISSELQELAYVFNASILATEPVLVPYKEQIEFNYRNIGNVIMKGRSEALNIYDIYESDAAQLRKMKHRTKETFNQAIVDFQKADFRAARSGFVKVLSRNSEDNIAKAYFYLSDLYFREGPPDEWNKALDLNKVSLDSQN